MKDILPFFFSFVHYSVETIFCKTLETHENASGEKEYICIIFHSLKSICTSCTWLKLVVRPSTIIPAHSLGYHYVTETVDCHFTISQLFLISCPSDSLHLVAFMPVN